MSVIAWGMPAFTSVVPMNQSSMEKNEWSPQIAIRFRPVYARASFTAAVVTSEPFLANFTMSAPSRMLDHRFRKVHFDLRGPSEIDAKLHLPISSLDNRFKGMPKCNRP